MSSIAMSAFATLGRTCLIPNAAGYRIGRHPRPPMRSSHAFHVCRLNKQHMASIAVGLGIITLLLIIFAYHGGHGVGSWFYSLLVVISGLTFVIFGPLLLCRFLMHAYYRQLESRTLRIQSDQESQTATVTDSNRPHVYACIIIAPEEITGSFAAVSRLSDLPTYEEAVVQKYNCHVKNIQSTSCGSQNTGTVSCAHGKNSEEISCFDSEDMVTLGESSVVNDAVDNNNILRRNSEENAANEDIPPPSYSDALSVFARHQEKQQNPNDIDGNVTVAQSDISSANNPTREETFISPPLLATNFSV